MGITKRCTKCGIEKDASQFSRNKLSKDGFVYTCKECSNILNRTYRERPGVQKKMTAATRAWNLSPEGKKSRQTWHQTLKGKFRSYKSNARVRNISFEITLEEFETFWQKPCWYADCSINTIGLDRIDNTKGYSLSNLIPCCETHNKMRMDLSQEAFLLECKRVAMKHSSGLLS